MGILSEDAVLGLGVGIFVGLGLWLVLISAGKPTQPVNLVDLVTGQRLLCLRGGSLYLVKVTKVYVTSTKCRAQIEGVPIKGAGYLGIGSYVDCTADEIWMF